jgi:hypothetical protein
MAICARAESNNLANSSSIALGLSGGGITGLLAAMCQLEHLHLLLPPNLTTVTASGGTLGYLVHHSTTSAARSSNSSSSRRSILSYPPPVNFSMS